MSGLNQEVVHRLPSNNSSMIVDVRGMLHGLIDLDVVVLLHHCGDTSSMSSQLSSGVNFRMISVYYSIDYPN